MTTPDDEPTVEQIVQRRHARLATVADALAHLPAGTRLSWSATRVNAALRYGYQGVSPIVFIDGVPRPVVLSVYSHLVDVTLDPFSLAAPYDIVVHSVYSVALRRPVLEVTTAVGEAVDTAGAQMFATALGQARTKVVTFPAWSIAALDGHLQSWVAAVCGRDDIEVAWEKPATPIRTVGTDVDTFDLGDAGRVSSTEFDTMLREFLDDGPTIA